jgi:hypothetical protein
MSTERVSPRVSRACLEAAAIGLSAALVALAFNFVRPGGLPLMASAPYETLVPCPEPGGEVTAWAPEAAMAERSGTALIDARGREAFAAFHLPGALSVPYDWLDPTPDGRLHELVRTVAASGAQRVLVYGDGGRPDSGEYLAREISGRGIKNVGFVRGGLPALRAGRAR